MKTFKLTAYNPDNEAEIYSWIILKAKNEIILKAIVREKWFEIKDYYEVETKKWKLDKIKDWFSSNFSASYWFDQKKELIILSSLSKALKRWFPQQEAFEQTKFSFWKSDVSTRKQIDKLIDTDPKKVSHISDIFLLNEEMFSPNFLALMTQAKDVESKVDKIISNPVPEEKKWEEIEWYVELTESVYNLTTELKQKISKPILWFLWMFSLVLWILVFLVPFMIEWFSKFWSVEDNFYFYVWEITLAVSHYFSEYALYVFILLFIWLGVFVFFYNKNKLFKESVHKYLLNMYIIGDTISLIQTKKITSYMAIFHESWMRWEKIFEILIPLTPYIPIKKELEYIKNQFKSHDFDTIFKSYSDDEKYLTEMFYVQLAKESNWYSKMTWRFWIAFASILLNTEDQWNDSISKYPDKISKLLNLVWFSMIWFFTVWIWIVMIVTLIGSLNNV